MKRSHSFSNNFHSNGNNPFKKPRKFKPKGPTRNFVPRSFGNPLAIAERKYFDTEYAAAIATSTTNWTGTEADPATILTFFAPIQGTGFNNRVGRKCQILSIKIRGSLTLPAQVDQTAAEQPIENRFILYQDKQTNAVQSQGEEVIASGAGSDAIHMYQNPANFGRFKVMKDKTVTIQNPNISYDGANIETNGLIKTFKISWKFKKPLVVHFNATNGGTVADIVDHSLHLIANSTIAGMALSYKCRVTFIDI